MCISEEKKNSNNRKSKSHGRSRTKTRKPKYLSLSKDMEKPSPETEITEMAQQLNLFPLHPELINDRSFADHHENVALLFDSESTAGDASLTGLLRPSPEHEGSPSYERTYDSESLVRAAMKRRNDNDGGQEEKWVCYSEVVEEVTSSSSKNAVVLERRSKKSKKRKSSTDNNNSNNNNKVETTTTTMSSNSEGNSVISANSCSSTSLALKLDYEGILNAWSDKGPLYIQPNQNLSSLQTVPDLLHCDHGLEGGWGSSVGNLWKVPENDDIKIKEESEGWKLGQREASVLRYKEKRQNRLFSKKIRYEVRKLNAEKRPRMKGRFVKTC